MNPHRTGRIDRDTADALLAGAPATAHGLDRLGTHLAAATAPGQPHELTGRAAALAAFRAARAQPATEQRRTSMIKTALAKLITIKAAAVLAVTAAGGVALAASTGALPNPLANPPAATPSPTHPTGRPATTPSHPAADNRNMSSPSLVGLCHAYTSGAGNDHGKALADPAFTALVTAAGGTDKVDAFCTTILTAASASPGAAAGHGQGSDASTHPTGQPSTGPGSGHPTGAPSTHPSAPPSHPGH
jgi:hypothetical protein